jgi:hypothetical protein
MSPRTVLLLVSAIVVACGATAAASILGMNQLKLDFTKPAVAKQASWTKSAKLKLGPRGLIFHAPGPEALDLSLQTTVPFATGTSWRPAGSVSIRATLSPRATPIRLDNGQTYTPSPGQMFARYSPDAKHWSTWQPLADATAPTGYTFSGQLAVPRQAHAEYGKLVSKYMTLDVPWRSDEEACVRWILKSRPDFFAKQLPFIGYVQFLYEASLAGGQRIERINFDVSFGVGGLHMQPKDPKTSVGRDGPWRFRAP